MGQDRISARLHERVRRDFPDADMARGVVYALRAMAVEHDDGSPEGLERLLAAAVFYAAGDMDRLYTAIREARLDWCDLLVVGGLADEDCFEILDAELGPR